MESETQKSAHLCSIVLRCSYYHRTKPEDLIIVLFSVIINPSALSSFSISSKPSSAPKTKTAVESASASVASSVTMVTMMTKQEIRKILQVSSRRERAIISVMASSGLRVSAALKLQLKHFRDDVWNSELPFYALEVPEKLSKDGEPYLTFITSEAAEYVRDLLLDRRDGGEKLGSDSFLFVASRSNRSLSVKRFGNIWRLRCVEAGLDMRPVTIKGYHPVGKKGGGVKLEKESVRYNIRIHSLRKFFKTSCSVNGVDRMASESFMGHSLNQFGVESLYDFAVGKQDWLGKEYLKVIPTVTFLKPLPTLPVKNGVARERIKELEGTVSELEQKLEGYTLTGTQVLELLRRIEKLEKQAQKQS